MKRIPSIGQPFPRQDALSKVTGREKYAVDYLWTRISSGPGLNGPASPMPGFGASIWKRPENLPGVIAVLTHRDVSGSNRQGIIRKDQPVLVDDKARHCGDAVALVLAEDKAGPAKGPGPDHHGLGTAAGDF